MATTWQKQFLVLLSATTMSSYCLLPKVTVQARPPALMTNQRLTTFHALAQLTPLVDRQLFFQDPVIDDPQLSPDGQYLAFRKPLHGVMNLWVKRIDDAMDAAVPVTQLTRSPVAFYFWSADSRYLVYGQDRDGDENFQLYRVEPEFSLAYPEQLSEAMPLTPYGAIQVRIYGVPQTMPESIIVGINDRDPRFHDVYQLNLTTGERKLLFEGQPGIIDWTVDHAGHLRLATRQTDQGRTEILANHQGRLQPVYHCSLLEICTPISFSPNNQKVYFKSNRGENIDLTQLVLLDLKTQAATLISRDPEGAVDLEGAIFSSATDELLGAFYRDDRLRVDALDHDFSATWSFLKQQFPHQDFYSGPLTEDDRLSLIVVQSDINPGTVYLFDWQQRHLQKLYDSRPELDQQWLVPMQPIRYIARDGLEIPAYLTLPRQVAGQRFPIPTVVMPHGGPWGRDTWGRDTWGYNPYVQFLANRGYAVLQPNFRGSAGYGKAFLNAGNQTWGTGAMQHDLTDGVYYLIDQQIALPEDIGIFGGSYGGYATLAGLTFTPDLYAAGVSLAGPTNLLTLLASIPPYWSSLRALFAIRLGDLNSPTDRLRLAEQSPLFAIANIKAPLLIIQGANDPRVTQREADQMVAALRNAGKPVEYLLAPDEGHGFRKQENLLAAMATMEQFLAKHLGGRFQAYIPPEIEQRLEQITVDIDTVELSEQRESQTN